MYNSLFQQLNKKNIKLDDEFIFEVEGLTNA